MHTTTGPDLARPADRPGVRAGGLARRIAAGLRYQDQHAGIGCIVVTAGAAVWGRAPGTGLPDRAPA